MLESTWELGGFTAEAKAQTAEWLLRLWQKGRRDSAADKFLNELAHQGVYSDTNQVTRREDLKTPPELVDR